MTDVAVIGGGIVGLATARALALRGRQVLVLERESRLGSHQTSHNSGVIHAGIYYTPGSLRARLCVEGAARLYEYCAEKGIEAVRCGKLVIAVGDEDLPRLDELERRAQANGVPGAVRIGASEIADVEPAATGLAALHSPNTGMVDYAAVARHYAQDIVDNGGELRAGMTVQALREVDGAVEVMGTGPLQPETGVLARVPQAVACAGGWSDRLAAASGVRPDVRIVPFRGGYLTLTPDKADLVRGQIYPVPDPSLPFLGVHLSRTVGGEVLIGPTALMVGARDAYRVALIRPADLTDALTWPGTWRLIRRFWRTGIKELQTAASKRVLARDAARYVPAITAADVRPGPAGVRAQALGRDGALVDDFLVARTGRALHVLNAPSPAATASLAIGDMVVEELDR